MFTWLLAFTLQAIIDNYLAPQYMNSAEVRDARCLLDDYWKGSDTPNKSRLELAKVIDGKFGGSK